METVQPHDEEAQEMAHKHYFGSAQYYCVETICAPCGVVIGWEKFAKSESPTKIFAVFEQYVSHRKFTARLYMH